MILGRPFDCDSSRPKVPAADGTPSPWRVYGQLTGNVSLPYTSEPIWLRVWAGAPPILAYFSGDWDVHWGYDLAFDPWPY